jgi:hypothetical protein
MSGGNDDRIAANCPYCGAPVMLDPPTYASPATGYCWRCNNLVKLGEPKQEPERDAWVIELTDATEAQAKIAAVEIASMLGVACTITRGTVAGVFYKRARGLDK